VKPAIRKRIKGGGNKKKNGSASFLRGKKKKEKNERPRTCPGQNKSQYMPCAKGGRKEKKEGERFRELNPVKKTLRTSCPIRGGRTKGWFRWGGEKRMKKEPPNWGWFAKEEKGKEGGTAFEHERYSNWGGRRR